jgi:hypothetical protein
MRVDSDSLVLVLRVEKIQCSDLDADSRVLHEFLIGLRWSPLQKNVGNPDHVKGFLFVKVSTTNKWFDDLRGLLTDLLRCQ